MSIETERQQPRLSRQSRSIPPFIRAETISQPTPSNSTAVSVAMSGTVGEVGVGKAPLSDSFENESASAAKELLRNVQQDDKQDSDSRRKKAFGKRVPSPIPSQTEKRYAKMGILYSSSPEPTRSTATLSVSFSPRFSAVGSSDGDSRGSSPTFRRPVSYHSGTGRGVACSGPSEPHGRESFCSFSPNETSLDFGSKSVEVVKLSPYSSSPPETGISRSPFHHPKTNGSSEVGPKSSPPIRFKVTGSASAQGGGVAGGDGGSPVGGGGTANSDNGGGSASSPDSGYGNTPDTTITATATSSCTTTAKADRSADGGTCTFVSKSRVTSGVEVLGGPDRAHVGGNPGTRTAPGGLSLHEAEKVVAENDRFDRDHPLGAGGVFSSERTGSGEDVSFANSEKRFNRVDLGRLSGSSPELIFASTGTGKAGVGEMAEDDDRRYMYRSSSTNNLLPGDRGGSAGESSCPTPVSPQTPSFPFPSFSSSFSSTLRDRPHSTSASRQDQLQFGRAVPSPSEQRGGISITESLGTRKAPLARRQVSLGGQGGSGGEGEWTGRPRSGRVDSTDPIQLALEDVVIRRRRQRSFSQPLVKSSVVKAPPPLFDEKDYFQVTDELGQENSHFMISEALLTVIEQYKANCAEQRLDESMGSGDGGPAEDLPDGTPSISQQPDTEPSSSFVSPSSPSPSPASSYRTFYGSPSAWSSGSPGDDYAESLTPRRASRVSLLELIQSPAGDNSAESTAQRFLQHVARHLTGNYGEELSMTQTVLQLPTEFLTSLQMDEDLQKSVITSSRHMRGNKDWAPPRAQIIFHIKSPSRSMQKDLVAQGYRCTGCGMKVDHVYFRYFRFCHYTGKYFCQNCHTNATAIIPAYVMRKWSFRKYAVSNFARDLLAKIHSEPVFNVRNVNAQLYSRVPVMAQARELRRQLVSVKEYLRTCRQAESLNATFEGYAPWTVDVHTYAMEDFIQIKNGVKLRFLRSMLTDAIKHVKNCPLCQGKGFVCEFCMNMKDIIYPFELHRITRCKECRCCFHQECYKKAEDKACPRCIRQKERQKQRQAAIASPGGGEDRSHEGHPS